MRISDWSSDVCSSDLVGGQRGQRVFRRLARRDLRRLGDEPLEIGSERGAGRRLAGDACLETRFLFAGCKPFIPFGVKRLARLAEGRPGGRDIGGGYAGPGGRDRTGAVEGTRLSVRVHVGECLLIYK